MRPAEGEKATLLRHSCHKCEKKREVCAEFFQYSTAQQAVNVDYKQTLDFLYAQLPMFQRIGPAAFKKDLTNTLALCAHLGNPQHQLRSIHVGGTNGKGSVSHLLAAVLQATGLKTGLYVSPHYKDFRERIKIDGKYIPRAQVVDFVGKNRAAIEQIQPSFFELCVAMAFDFFARQRVDVAIIEVGLGGRLDSTNVITPELSVITNISYDHQNMLGNTLPEIAGEKAGIIKPGVPVVIGETHPESAPVFLQKAAEMNAPIIFADQHFRVVEQTAPALDTGVFNIEKDGQPLFEQMEAGVSGPFQSKNIATLMQALSCLQDLGFPSTPQEIRFGLKHLRTTTRFMGRWQIIGTHPTILCDSAHNEAGLKMVFDHQQPISPLQTMRDNGGQLHVVTGFVNDKEVDGVLNIFPRDARYYFAKANIPRGLDAGILKAKAAQIGLQGRAYSSVRNALKAAKRVAKPEDLILVLGSIFVVAEVI